MKPQHYHGALMVLKRMQEIHAMLSHQPMKCREIADRLEVGRITAYRTLCFMRDQLGMPLEYDWSTGLWAYTSDSVCPFCNADKFLTCNV
jgi:predicted DNA-binding transcriptional regulator YafY